MDRAAFVAEGRRAIYDVEKSDSTFSIHRVKDFSVRLPLNAVKALAYPVCAYSTCVPNELTWCVFVGNGEEDRERRAYHTDVVCDDFVYLLSQRRLDLQSMSGLSQIEVYDYSGRPVKVVILDIVATKMVYDKRNGRFVFLSPEDNALHVLEWAENGL